MSEAFARVVIEPGEPNPLFVVGHCSTAVFGAEFAPRAPGLLASRRACSLGEADVGHVIGQQRPYRFFADEGAARS